MISTGLIGLGKIGFKYGQDRLSSGYSLTHFEAISSNPDIELLFGSDKDMPSCIHFNKRTGIPSSINQESLLAQFKPEMLVIATPTLSRKTDLERIFSIWVPKILVLEKPLSSDLQTSLGLSKLLNELGIQVFLNYQRNYLDPFEDIRQELNKPEFGKLLSIQGEFTGTLSNSGSHLIALIDRLVGPINFNNPRNIPDSNTYCFNHNDSSISLRQLKKFPGFELSLEITTDRYQYKYSSPRSELARYPLVESTDYREEFFFDSSSAYCLPRELKNGIDRLYENIVSFKRGESFYSLSTDKALVFDSIIDALQTEDH